MEDGRRRDTTARSREQAVAKEAEVVESLARGWGPTWPEPGARTWWSTTSIRPVVPCGAGVVAAPPRGAGGLLRRYVLPVIGTVEVRALTRRHFAQILEAAPSPSVATHLRRCLSAMVTTGLEEGLLLASQDVLRGVHVAVADPGECEEDSGFVEEADIPTATVVHTLAARAARIRTPMPTAARRGLSIRPALHPSPLAGAGR